MQNLVLNLTADAIYCSKHLEYVIRYKRLTGDCINKDMKNNVILANIAIITTCNTTCSSVYFLRVNRWCN